MDDTDFKKLLKEARSNLDIIGFLLGGSRGKGYQTKYSDWDARMIVKDGLGLNYRKKYEGIKFNNVDFSVLSLSEFKEYAKFGSEYEWDRYDFTHVKALVDKNKQIQKLIDEKGSIPKKIRRKYISGYLDAYINGVFRSLKSFKNGFKFGSRLEAVQAIPFFLSIIFALEGQPRPFYNYLKRELQFRPLKKFNWSSNKIIDSILKVLETGDIKTQLEILRKTGKVFRKEGYGKVLDSWDVDHPGMFNLSLSDFEKMRKI